MSKVLNNQIQFLEIYRHNTMHDVNPYWRMIERRKALFAKRAKDNELGKLKHSLKLLQNIYCSLLTSSLSPERLPK